MGHSYRCTTIRDRIPGAEGMSMTAGELQNVSVRLWAQKSHLVPTERKDPNRERTPVDDPSSNSIAIHPLISQDTKLIDAMPGADSSHRRAPRDQARGPFDAVMEERFTTRECDVEAGPVGGIPGVRVLPSDWRPDEAVLHLQADGSTSAPPWPIAILWDMSQRGPKRGRSSPISASPRISLSSGRGGCAGLL